MVSCDFNYHVIHSIWMVWNGVCLIAYSNCKGLKIDTSESHRHICEVRFILKMTKQQRDEYLAGVEKARGAEARNRLWADAYQEYLKTIKK
jgi:hypothetical protein